MKGAVAAGHRLTAEAAAEILRDGGNAFDAVIAGFWVACVAEPVLVSLGGGGHLLARVGDGSSRVFDFFAHTPKTKSRDGDEADFRTVTVDFGAARQAFHIGLGACATPGAVRGMFSVHRRLASMPMRELARPAIELARAGVAVNAFQSYLLGLVAPIYRTASAFPLFASESSKGELARAGDVLRNPRLADVLEALSREGDALFYRGEIARRIVEQSRAGGWLTRADLRDYEVFERDALEVEYRGHRLATNPPPSAGGLLINLGFESLARCAFACDGIGGAAHVGAIAQALQAIAQARDQHCAEDLRADSPPSDSLARICRRVLARERAARGTT
ncbi:MAG: gamma-glutamyltransferase, partial [bacterium]